VRHFPDDDSDTIACSVSIAGDGDRLTQTPTVSTDHRANPSHESSQ
jgi:hypothetical protein